MKSNPGQDWHGPAPWRPRPARVLLVGALAGLAAAASAQTTAVDSGSARPVLPTALPYHSAIAGYQPYADQPVQSWREANDRVGRIGGWRAYAKEVMTGVSAGTRDVGKTSPGGRGHGHGHMPMGGSHP